MANQHYTLEWERLTVVYLDGPGPAPLLPGGTRLTVSHPDLPTLEYQAKRRIEPDVQWEWELLSRNTDG